MADTLSKSTHDHGGDAHTKDEQSWWLQHCHHALLVLAFLLVVGITLQLCMTWPESHPCLTYGALGLIPVFVVWSRVWVHAHLVEALRLVDLSEVEARFIEVKTVESRLTEPERPESFDEKKEQIETEVSRLRKLGKKKWTEYQILSLDQLLIEFLKVEDLKQTARSNLADLEEYALDSHSQYDIRHFDRWEKLIDDAIDKIEHVEKRELETATPSVHDPSESTSSSAGSEAKEIDVAAEPLRAAVRTLLEHIASYEKSWALGRAYLHHLMIVTVSSIPVLFAIGILPFLHPEGQVLLGILNWGALGVVGSLVAVAFDLRKRDWTEVGNTQAHKEIWRAVLGAVLGFIAGVLFYSMIYAGLLSGSAFPVVDAVQQGEDVFPASVFWGIASGFSFEWVLERMRGTMEGTR